MRTVAVKNENCRRIMLFSFHSQKLQPLAAVRTPTTSSTPAAKLVFAKLPATEAITKVSGQPDGGRVPNCCRSSCLDYVTIQSPAYAAKQECFH